MTPAASAYLLLDLAGRLCALSRASVREVLPLPHLHAPPAAGGPLAGFLNLSGAPVPVLDLARLLGLRAGAEAAPDAAPADAYSHVVLSAGGDLGLLVDRVVDLVQVPVEDLRPVSDARTLNGCVEAEIALGDRLVHVLSFARIVTREEQARLETLRLRAAARLAALPAET
ncbi:chemotaxis protein CheW [Methylobacterium organophilum]|uniref:CheW-like domain-containing protein n=1 Tax=Methylobacterium organophilum TaxID=410 RepID=A0ABQ4TD26_METOR|nr:chemotaxis protein CheW [Methylobacterium organophilum]GJE29595.1 hypothetical protein LKMONMHP_4477 [Methylobacterium organophilum]